MCQLLIHRLSAPNLLSLHALLPDAGPGDPATPFLLCLASAARGTADFKAGGRRGNLPSLHLQGSSRLLLASVHLTLQCFITLAGTDPFSWQHLNTACSFVQHLEKQFYQTLPPQTQASHCFSFRGLDPIQAPPLSSDTKQ